MTLDPKRNPHHNSDDTESDTTGNAPSGSDRVIIVDEQGKPYSKRTNTYERFKDSAKKLYDKIDHGERLMIVLTSVIALSTVCQLVMYFLSNSSSSKQVDHIIVAADRIDDAADSFSKSSADISRGIRDAVQKLESQDKEIEASRKSSATSARKYLQATLDIGRLDQRAWVGFVDGKFHIVKGKPISSEVNVIVLGKTPAVEIKNHCNVAFVETNRISTPSYFSYSEPLRTNGTVAPNNHFPLQWQEVAQTNAGNNQFSDRTVDGQFTPYFYCEVTYKDIFRSEHWVHFCITANQRQPDGTPCIFYNDSDADYEDKK